MSNMQHLHLVDRVDQLAERVDVITNEVDTNLSQFVDRLNQFVDRINDLTKAVEFLVEDHAALNKYVVDMACSLQEVGEERVKMLEDLAKKYKEVTGFDPTTEVQS